VSDPWEESICHVKYECVTSRMHLSHYTWMRHVTCEWVTSHMNESCHIWMRHFTYEWGISHMNKLCYNMKESCDICMHLVTYEPAHMWLNVTTEWVISLQRTVNESYHTWMSHVTREWVMSHVNESCHRRIIVISWNSTGRSIMNPYANESFKRHPQGMP